jgi:hypothetical protein
MASCAARRTATRFLDGWHIANTPSGERVRAHFRSRQAARVVARSLVGSSRLHGNAGEREE